MAFNVVMPSFRRTSLTFRTVAVSAALAVVLAGAMAVLVVAIVGQRDAGRRALRSQEAITAGTQLERSIVSLENGLRGYISTRNGDQLGVFNAARRAYPEQVRRLSRLVGDEPALRERLRLVATEADDYVNLWALPLLALAREDLAQAKSQLGNEIGRARVHQLRSDFGILFARERALAGQRERHAEARSDVAVGLGIAGIVLVVVLSAGLAWWLRRSVVLPIRRVRDATGRVAEGDLRTRLPGERPDEIGDLERAFNAMTAALQQTLRELEDYASVTSHDLQGPLITVGMHADLLIRRLEGDDESAEIARRISSGAAGMRQLVRDLLAYSRVGRAEPALGPVELNGVIAEALENLAGPIQAASAQVVTGPMPVVLGNPGQLAQVFQNLISNAVKFNEEPVPRVEISAESEAAAVHVRVRDNGIGLEASQAERVFRPFHRVHSQERFEGTGLGLAVCEKIVTRQGGRIWAEGVQGEGTTFHIVLPLSVEQGAQEPAVLAG